MKARVGTLSVGTLFVTRLTGRVGHVLRATTPDGTDVALNVGSVLVVVKTLHPDVVVETSEVVH